MNVVQRINIQRLRWLGHVVRVEEDAPAKRVFDEEICGSRRRGKPNRGSPLIDWCNQLAWARRKQKLRWLGQVVRMEENAPARQVFDAGICGSRRRGRPCIRWKDQIEDWCNQLA